MSARLIHAVLTRAAAAAALVTIFGGRLFAEAPSAEASGAGPRAIAWPSPAEEAFDDGLRRFDEARAFAEAHATARDEARARYLAAGERFVDAWTAGAESTEVATNAANSFAFAGDEGRAVLFYRRALALDPSNDAARRGLEHIRSGLPIQKAAGGGAEILRALFFWHEGLGFGARRSAFLVLFPLAFASFALAMRRRFPFLPLGSVLLGASVLLLGSILVDALGSSAHRDAVVTTEVVGRLGDGGFYSPSHSRPFPPGTEVEVLEVRKSDEASARGAGGWVQVRLLDRSTSWVPDGTIEHVIP